MIKKNANRLEGCQYEGRVIRKETFQMRVIRGEGKRRQYPEYVWKHIKRQVNVRMYGYEPRERGRNPLRPWVTALAECPDSVFLRKEGAIIGNATQSGSLWLPSCFFCFLFSWSTRRPLTGSGPTLYRAGLQRLTYVPHFCTPPSP